MLILLHFWNCYANKIYGKYFLLVTKKVQNNEDYASPAKAFVKKKLDIKGYICLICGQISRKEGLQKQQEKEIAIFIKSLKLHFVCNGYKVSYFSPSIDFEKIILISETDSVRQHPRCYSTFWNPKHISCVTSQESRPSYDAQEPGPSSSESRATRFKPLISYKGSLHILWF